MVLTPPMPRLLAMLAATLLLSGGAPAGAAAPAKLKVLISVDMEGVAGAVTADQLSPGGFEYERFRGFMTDEALAAVEGAKAAGATEIVVADAHGNLQNLLIEKFPPEVRIIRAAPRRLSMVSGLDTDVDALVFIGYHAGTDNTAGVRAHTFSSASLTHVALNGQVMTEGAWNAAIAGHFGVPVVMISGDDAAIAEVRAVVGDIEAAEVKRSLGFHAADTLTPMAANALIRERTQRGIERRKEFRPLRVREPVTVDVSLKNYTPVEMLAYLPLFERTGSHAIRFRAKDMTEASDILDFLLDYRVDLSP